MSGQKTTQFDTFSKFLTPLITTSMQVKLETGQDTQQDKRWFDWESFKSSVDRSQGDNLIFDNSSLIEALGVVMNEKAIKSLTFTLEATFTNLKEKSSNGFLDFNKPSDGHNLSLVTTIKVQADSLVGASSKSFSATIDAMELVVMKGFKNPT
ncbi:delta-endotoxin CytB [Colletotrichum godetiae]|uniref:Delta-endotoxin CytB n=1 Tax=Colletotrichum godetiae TaxID=1209918 RepID=A0AAJ0EVP3_9PEZI|nr:delta-endotoxin CytB [Colletotrichum godetiae]KAK1688989.1 delta-endotoxin CytB [Colletotrichum godetiae]